MIELPAHIRESTQFIERAIAKDGNFENGFSCIWVVREDDFSKVTVHDRNGPIIEFTSDKDGNIHYALSSK